jgi:hypothetical protein
MPINRSSIPDLLLPGLADLTGKYPELPTRWREFLAEGTSKMALERIGEMRYTGLAELKSEGGATTFDNAPGERFVWNIEHRGIGLGFAMSRESLDDNLYKDQFNPQAMGLVESFAQTKEILNHQLLNNATVANPLFGGDQQPLASTAHPIDNGTYANRPAVDLDFNESAVESALNQIRQFPDQAGLLVMSRGMKVIGPLALQWSMERLFKTELRVGTANNDVSAILSSGALPDGYAISEFLTSNFAWGILTNVKGLVYYDRVPFEMDLQVDPTTGNLLVIGYERYGSGIRNPRGIWWTAPTA